MQKRRGYVVAEGMRMEVEVERMLSEEGGQKNGKGETSLGVCQRRVEVHQG